MSRRTPIRSAMRRTIGALRGLRTIRTRRAETRDATEKRMQFYPVSERPKAISQGYWQPSDALLSRIKRSYRLSLERGNASDGLMWQSINARKIAIHEALLRDDTSLRPLLSNP